MISEFKALFTDETWNKGDLYYREGRVKYVRERGNQNIAEVWGSKHYKLEFSVKANTMKCNCSYAKEGFRCKHMAAALIAYEHKEAKKEMVTKTTSSKKSIEENSWYPYIKESLNQRKEVIRFRLLYSGLESYFKNMLQERRLSMISFNELMQLLVFLNNANLGYSQQDTILNIVSILSTIRKTVVGTQREALDSKIIKFVKKNDDGYFVNSLIKHYFIEEDDYVGLLELLKQTKKAERFVDSALDFMIERQAKDEKIELFCLALTNNRKTLKWLAAYYKSSEQYEKGIQLLEKYCLSENRIEADIEDAQMSLLWFYGKTNRIALKNSLFAKLVKSRRVNKAKLFTSLKDIMSKEEWNKSGKKMLRDWSLGKSDDACYEVYAEVEAGDLMFEKMLTSGYTIYSLKTYFDVLCNYDEGLLYSLYKHYLRDLLENQPVYAKHTLSNFLYTYPKTPRTYEALKIMLVELEKIFQDQVTIVDALEECEEMLYEEKI